MPRFTTNYICEQCGYNSPTYLGKCPQCDSWNSFVENVEMVGKNNNLQSKSQNQTKKAEIIELQNVEKIHYKRLDTGLEEFNRVLGGGVVNGSVVLVSGDPGIGKSTLLTQLAINVPKTLYVAGEESAQQIKIRVDRIKSGINIPILNEVDVDVIIGAVEEFKPTLMIIDSIQTLETQDLNAVAGSVSQVRECAHRLQRLAKRLHIPIFLVGHVTKEGTLAGPKTLEHLVDVVLSLEGETENQFRILRSAKNRFGPTDEVGVFEMEESGMIEVKNPSKIFLAQRINAPGSAVVAILTGIRPLLIEIQALVTRTSLPIPRRTGSGIDNNRLQLLVAVLQKRLGLSLYDQDIFVNVTGGMRITEPAADLGICMAIASSFKDQSIDPKSIFIGEVGLLGELRVVRQLEKRANEAKKLGFEKVVSPESAKTLSQVIKISLTPVKTIG